MTKEYKDPTDAYVIGDVIRGTCISLTFLSCDDIFKHIELHSHCVTSGSPEHIRLIL